MENMPIVPEVKYTPDCLESTHNTEYGDHETASSITEDGWRPEVANKNRFVREGSCRTQNFGSTINSGTYYYNSGGT